MSYPWIYSAKICKYLPARLSPDIEYVDFWKDIVDTFDNAASFSENESYSALRMHMSMKRWYMKVASGAVARIKDFIPDFLTQSAQKMFLGSFDIYQEYKFADFDTVDVWACFYKFFSKKKLCNIIKDFVVLEHMSFWHKLNDDRKKKFRECFTDNFRNVDNISDIDMLTLINISGQIDAIEKFYEFFAKRSCINMQDIEKSCLGFFCGMYYWAIKYNGFFYEKNTESLLIDRIEELKLEDMKIR